MSEFVTAKLELEETSATIAAHREFIPHAVEAIKAARHEIEKQIRKDSFFLTTLEPYDDAPAHSRVVRRMCEAARSAGVGPMATVAGVIAQEALEAMVAQGCTHGWVDNGGDVALVLDSPVTVEVFSDPGSGSATVLELEPETGFRGVCTSSGRLGHSISFGDADAAAVIATDACVADAIATAVANRIKGPSSLQSCFDGLKEISGFIGGLALIDGMVAICGKVPPLMEGEHNPERVTAHSKMSSERYTGRTRQGTEMRT
jgi:hypothetical protein